MLTYQGRKCKLVSTWFDQAGVRWARLEFAGGEQLTVRADEVGV